MLRTVFLAAVLLCAVAMPAHAKPRHLTPKVHGKVWGVNSIGSGCSDPVMRPCEPVQIGRKYSKTISVNRSSRGHHLKALKRLAFRSKSDDFDTTHWNTVSRPTRYIAGRLVCAVNVNAELARRGIRGTGSARSLAFLRWGRASRPVEGAVAVYGRKGGGHVAIVSRVVGGRVWVWNPSSRAHRWREVEYRKRAIAYRVAGW